MFRFIGLVALLALAVASNVNATSGSGPRPRPSSPRALAPGVFLSIDECHVEPAREADGLIEARVTLSNYGAAPLKVDYFTFSLSNASGGRSPALLPSELNGRTASPLPSREGVLATGQKLVAVVYFRSPSSDAHSIDLRVDLATADGRLLSRSFLPLGLN